MPDAVPQSALDAARGFARQGRTADAEQAYARLLDASPDLAEALNFLTQCAMQRGDLARTLHLLEHAVRHHPSDPSTWMNLGAAREAQGDLTGARDAYLQAVREDPGQPTARLYLGHALERLQQEDEALFAYFRAITDAQKKGQWHNKATTPPLILDLVTHAMRFVKAGRRRVFERILAPVMQRHGADALQRVQNCLAIHVGDRRQSPDDPRQKPSLLYFPGLPTTPYLGRALFPWVEEFESHNGTIRDELRAVLPQAHGLERVFADDAQERTGLRGAQPTPTWEGFYFYRHGERRDDNHRRCPDTSVVLDSLPLVKIREQAPEVMFSVLMPGTHILPHRGVTNTRVVCHLPLIVPDRCALVVGGETHHWREGRAVFFDDTFEHEAWNRGDQTRVVLIVDVWNPHLTPAERDAVTTLVAAIGDFHKESAA